MFSIYSVRLTNKLLSTDLSTTISDVRFWWWVANFTNESFVLTTDDEKTFELVECSAAAGVVTFIKRGLDNTNVKTEVPALKLDWWAGTLMYLTQLASDINNWLNTRQATPDLVPLLTTLTIPVNTQRVVHNPTILGTVVLNWTLIIV